MNSRAARRFSRRRGLTLVETLVALSLTALVAGLLLAAFHGLRRGLDAQLARAAGRGEISRALRRMRDDLLGAGAPLTNLALRLDWPDEAASTNRMFSFCTTHGRETRGDPEWPEWWRVRLIWTPAGDGRGALTRVVEPLATRIPAPAPHTNRLAEGLADARFRAYDGASWRTNWNEAALPAAVEITWRPAGGAGGGPPETAVMIVPAGLVVTSRLLRAANPSPTPPALRE